MFPLNVHLKAKCLHPALHFWVQGRLSLAWVCCSREWFIFLCKKHVCLFRWKKPVDHSVLPTTFFGAPWIDCRSCILHPWVWNHAWWLSSAILHSRLLFGAPWIDCLALFMCPPPSSADPLDWEMWSLLFSRLIPPPTSLEPCVVIA